MMGVYKLLLSLKVLYYRIHFIQVLCLQAKPQSEEAGRLLRNYDAYCLMSNDGMKVGGPYQCDIEGFSRSCF